MQGREGGEGREGREGRGGEGREGRGGEERGGEGKCKEVMTEEVGEVRHVLKPRETLPRPDTHLHSSLHHSTAQHSTQH